MERAKRASASLLPRKFRIKFVTFYGTTLDTRKLHSWIDETQFTRVSEIFQICSHVSILVSVREKNIN